MDFLHCIVVIGFLLLNQQSHHALGNFLPQHTSQSLKGVPPPPHLAEASQYSSVPADKLLIGQQQITQPTNQNPALTTRDVLPAIDSLLNAKETKDGKEYEIFGCKLTLSTKDDCSFTFNPTSEECKEKLSLSKIFDYMFTKVKLSDTVKKFIPILIYNIETFTLNKCTGDVSFQAKARETFEIAKNIKVKDGYLKMELNYKQPSLEKMSLEIKGKLDLKGKEVPITFIKKKDSLEGSFSVQTDEVKIADFKSALTTKDLPGESSTVKSSPNVGVFTDLIVKNPQISGTKAKDGFMEMVLSGKVTGIKGIGEAMLFLVVQKPADEATGVGVLVYIKKISPSTFLSTLLDIDLTGKIPLLGNVELDIVVEASNKEMITLKDADLNKLLAKYTNNGKAISEGFRFKCTVPIRKILTDSVKDLKNEKNIPEKIMLQVVMTKEKVDFIFPEDFKSDLINIAIALTPKLSEKVLQKVASTPPKIAVKKFDIDVKTLAVDVELITVEPLVLKGGFFKLKEATFKLTHKPEGSWDFILKAKQQMGKGLLSVNVEKKGDMFVLNAEISDVTTKNLLEHFVGENAKENEIAKKMEKLDFLNFGIKDLKVNSRFEGEKINLNITGNPVLFDWEGLKFQGFIYDNDKGRQMALAVLMENIKIDKIIEKFMKKPFDKIAWMSRARASLLISNTEEKDLMDFKALNEKFELKQGVFFKAEFHTPQECNQDKMCEVIKDKFPADTKFMLEGKITVRTIELKAFFTGSGISFGDKIFMDKIELKLRADIMEGAYVSLAGQIRIVEPALTVSGKIAIGLAGSVDLSLTMGGMWEKPFGISFVAIGNLMLGTSLDPKKPIPQFDVTGELHIGKIGTPDVIKARVASGLDIYNPWESYFHAQLSEFTLGKILKAYGADISLPKPLEDTGFPKGVLVAFSGNPKGKNLEHMKLQIDPGFKFYGLINMLGLEAECDISVRFPLDIKVSVELMPIKIAKGALVLARSRENLDKGPKVFVGISKTSVAIKVEAYVNLLGIGAETLIDISNKGFHFYVYGNLFNMIAANVTVKAPYAEGSIANAAYEISACLSTSVKEISMTTKETMEEGAEASQKAENEAKKEIEETGLVTDSSKEDLGYWEAKLKKKEDAINRKAAKLEKIKDFLNNDCVDQCEDICVPGVSTKKTKKKILGITIKKPVINECAHKVENLNCLTKCKTKKLYLKGKAAKKKVTTEILIKSIEIIRKIMALSQQFAEYTQKFVQMVEEAGQKIEEAAAAGKKALDAFAKYTRDNIIDIRHICFNTTLAKVKDACFAFNVDIMFGGKHHLKFDINACIDTSFAKSIGKEIADKVLPGIGKVKGKLAKAKEYFKNIGKKKEELKEKEEEVKTKQKHLEGEVPEEVDDDDDDDDEDENEEIKSRRANIEQKGLPKSKQWAYVYQQVYRDLPSITFNDDKTLDAFNSRSAWAVVATDDPMVAMDERTGQEEDKFVSDDDNDDIHAAGAQKEDIHGQDNTCVPLYSGLTEGVGWLLDSFMTEIEAFKKETRKAYQRNNETETEIKRLSAKGNFSKEQNDILLGYSSKLHEGTKLWSRTIIHQIKKQEDVIFNQFKGKVNDALLEKYSLSLDKMLESHKDELKKRSHINQPRGGVDLAKALERIDVLLKNVFSEDYGSITSKRHMIRELRNQVDKVKTTCF